MAKKSTPPQPQSPENYIRTRARKLEIFECRIDEIWEETRMANIIVARKHTNGNITYGIYLVDLLCLGVKDSFFGFNEIESLYNEKIKRWEEVNKFKKIDYVLAHNIIYAAVEFAEDFGFNPHHSFTNVTQYLLEEDTDDIELIDIECGMDGKPAYFQGPNDNKTTVNRILKQLETTAGKGNFNFSIEGENLPDDSDNEMEGLDEEDDFEDYDDDDDDYDEDEDDDYDEDYDDDDFDDEEDYDDEEDNDEEDMGVAEPRMSQEECLLIFNKHIHTFESIEPVELDMFLKAVHLLFKDLVDYNSYKQYYKDFSDDLDVVIVSNKMPYKALGVEIKDKTKRKSVINAISQFLYFEKWVEDDNVTDDEQQTKMLENMKEEYGDIPIFSFLEFVFFKDGNEFETQKNLEEYMNKFPDYPIFKISAMAHSVTKILGENPEAEIIPLHTFYPNRYRFHISEMQEYIMYATIIAAIGNNNPRMAAFFDILIDLEYPDEIFENVFPIISVQKIKAVKSSLGLPD